MQTKWLAKIEAYLEVEGEADSLSDFQHLVCQKLGGLFLEDEPDQEKAGLTVIRMEPDVQE